MKLIDCEEHGASRYSIICSHLGAGNGLGYFAIEQTATDPGQAWCEDCDVVLARERGWTDAADQQANWKLFCASCNQRTLQSHSLISWVEGSRLEDD